jgi:hypothetical protein
MLTHQKSKFKAFVKKAFVVMLGLAAGVSLQEHPAKQRGCINIQ